MRKVKVDPFTTYISADFHLGHDAEYVYKERGFRDIGEHDRYILDAVRKTPVGSTILHLGDLAYGAGVEYLQYMLDPVFNKGTKRRLTTIEGNRDHDLVWRLAKVNGSVEMMGDLAMFKCGEGLGTFVGCHYPLEEWPQKSFGFKHLHGHTHGSSTSIPNRTDVSVEALINNFGEPLVLLRDLLVKTLGEQNESI